MNIKDFWRKLTPWYDEDAADTRSATTKAAIAESHKARRSAGAEMLRSYRDSNQAIGRPEWTAPRITKR